MSFLSGLATGAQMGLQTGAGIQDGRRARALKQGREVPAATGLYGRYREVRDLQRADTALSPAAGAAQSTPIAEVAQVETPNREITAVEAARPAGGGMMSAMGSAAEQSLQKFRSIIGRA